jgi:hypothetical protein
MYQKDYQQIVVQKKFKKEEFKVLELIPKETHQQENEMSTQEEMEIDISTQEDLDISTQKDLITPEQAEREYNQTSNSGFYNVRKILQIIPSQKVFFSLHIIITIRKFIAKLIGNRALQH